MRQVYVIAEECVNLQSLIRNLNYLYGYPWSFATLTWKVVAMFPCSWSLALLLVFLQVSSGLVQGSKKQKLSSTKRATSFSSDQHRKTTQLPTHTRACANAARQQIDGRMEGGIAATLICISLNYHKPDFNKQCYNCVCCVDSRFCPPTNNDVSDSFGGHTMISDVISYDFAKTGSILPRERLTGRERFCWKWKVFKTEINLKHTLLLTAMASFPSLSYALVLQYWKPVNNLPITETESYKMLNICEYPASRPMHYSL